MPTMLTLAKRYIAHRRKMGYSMLLPANRLPQFARFADRAAPGKPLTATLALDWATARPGQRHTHAAWLSIVRGFATYCAALDPRTEVPDIRLLGPVSQRLRPHIFTGEQTRLLLVRARALTTRLTPLHPLTYEAMIALLACTGMRPGEALRLHLDDLDLDSGRLRIAPCKFSPSRSISLHPSTLQALQRYREARIRLFPGGHHMFVGANGMPLLQRETERVFARLARGIVPNGQRPSVRLLDFRHTFASRWISDWSRQSKPVSHHLLLLARYLGHQDFSSTWWYISSDPASLRAAADSFLRFHTKRDDAA